VSLGFEDHNSCCDSLNLMKIIELRLGSKIWTIKA
jgi:hypothetical protein